MNKILTKQQQALLEKIGKNSFLSRQFYLTGGTPLAAFYLQHRYSEDLDFFSEQVIDLIPLQVFFKEVKKELRVRMIDFQQSYNRNLFFLHFPSGILKIEFTYFPFPRIEKGFQKYGVEVDSILDIAVNKLFTIYQRTQARDYLDLYCLCHSQKYAVSDLIKKARIKFDWHIDPLQLGTQFVKAKEALDLPKMIKKIPSAKWQRFFAEEAKKLRPEILDHVRR